MGVSEPSRAAVVGALLFALALTSCGASDAGDSTDATTPAVAVASTASSTSTSTTPPSTTSTTSSTTTTSMSTSTSTTSTSTTSTTSTTTPTVVAPPIEFGRTEAVFDSLARANAAVTMSVWRDGLPLLQRAAGSVIDGTPATSDSPMVVASVSKLVTAALIGRLDAAGLIEIDAPVPWDRLGISPDPAWTGVTVRELLDHTSGMPVVRPSWFGGTDVCASFLPTLLSGPPQNHRGRWTYSNGNYCALGLLIEATTELTLDTAAQRILFDPLMADGIHLTTDGQWPTDIAYAEGVDRLSRLGGAGTFIVSTDDLAAMVAAAGIAEREAWQWPGVMIDQYGWGHTGTVDGAKSCLWVLEGGRTVVAATVAGNSPGTGGGICDTMVPAVFHDLSGDLSFDLGRPQRTPP